MKKLNNKINDYGIAKEKTWEKGAFVYGAKMKMGG